MEFEITETIFQSLAIKSKSSINFGSLNFNND